MYNGVAVPVRIGMRGVTCRCAVGWEGRANSSSSSRRYATRQTSHTWGSSASMHTLLCFNEESRHVTIRYHHDVASDDEVGAGGVTRIVRLCHRSTGADDTSRTCTSSKRQVEDSAGVRRQRKSSAQVWRNVVQVQERRGSVGGGEVNQKEDIWCMVGMVKRRIVDVTQRMPFRPPRTNRSTIHVTGGRKQVTPVDRSPPVVLPRRTLSPPGRHSAASLYAQSHSATARHIR